MYFINFNVLGQKMSLISKPEVITYSQNMLYAKFSVSDEWKNQTNTALFTENGNTYKVLLDEENKCLIPHEVLNSLYFDVGLIGGNLNTTNVVTVNTDKSIYRKNINESDQWKDIFCQITECVDYIKGQVISQNEKIEAIQAGEISSETIANAVSEYLVLNPIESITETEMIDYVTEEIGKISLTPGPKGDVGEDGKNGIDGLNGIDGTNGVTFTPKVNSSGDLSWSNDGGLTNPSTVNIKGDKGDTGSKGEQGPQGVQGIQGNNGVDGADGYTPERGLDYWNAEDIMAIQSYCEVYIDTVLLGGAS